MADREFLIQLTRKLADEGKLIEAGWIGLRLAAVPDNASPAQLNEMRMAFMAGAMHLFTAMMGMLEPGSDETPNDLRRMDLIHAELEEFEKEVRLRATKPMGRS